MFSVSTIQNLVRMSNLTDALDRQINLYNFQLELLETVATNQKVIARLPRQSGKTLVASLSALAFALENENSKVMFCTYTRYSKFNYVARIATNLNLVYSSNSRPELKFQNGSKIQFRSSKIIKDVDCDFLILDELEFNTVEFNVDLKEFPGKILSVSTPAVNKTLNHVWKNCNLYGFERFSVNWDAHPTRDEEWAEQQKKMFGEDVFSREYNIVDFF